MQVGELFMLFGLKTDSSWGRTQEQIGGFISNMDSRLRGLRRLFLGAGVFGLFREVAQASDEYSNLHSRLGLVASSQEEVNSLFERARGIAKETRSDLSMTTLGFVKVAQSVQGLKLGLSNNEVFDRLESMQKIMKVSGSTNQATKNAFEQLTQGLASNRLGGEEIRSVLEQLPTVADQIGKHLGKTRGELRKFSKDGGLTAKVILDAFGPKYMAEINARFAKIKPTIGDAWTQFKNDGMVALGELARDTGFVQVATFAFQALGRAMKLVIEVARTVGTAIRGLVQDALAGDDGAIAVLIGVGVVIGTIVVPALLAMAASSIAALAPFLAIGAAAALIGYAILKLIKYGPQIAKALGDVWTWVKQKADDFWSWLIAIPDRFIDKLSGFGDKIIAAFENAWEVVKQGAKDALNFVSETARSIPVLGWVGEKLGQGAGYVYNKLSGGEPELDGIDQIMQAPSMNAPAGTTMGSGVVIEAPITVTNHGVAGAEDATRQIQNAVDSSMRHAMHDLSGSVAQ